jgi:hypothetical protein
VCENHVNGFALIFFQGQPFVFSFGEFVFICRSLFSFSFVNKCIDSLLLSYLRAKVFNRLSCVYFLLAVSFYALL